MLGVEFQTLLLVHILVCFKSGINGNVESEQHRENNSGEIQTSEVGQLFVIFIYY